MVRPRNGEPRPTCDAASGLLQIHGSSASSGRSNPWEQPWTKHQRARGARGSVLFGKFVRDLCPGENAALKLSRPRPGTGMYRDGRSASATVHRQHSRQEEKHARNQNLHPVLVDRRFGSPAWGELHPALAERPRASAWPVLPPFIYHSMDDG